MVPGRAIRGASTPGARPPCGPLRAARSLVQGQVRRSPLAIHLKIPRTRSRHTYARTSARGQLLSFFDTLRGPHASSRTPEWPDTRAFAPLEGPMASSVDTEDPGGSLIAPASLGYSLTDALHPNGSTRGFSVAHATHARELGASRRRAGTRGRGAAPRATLLEGAAAGAPAPSATPPSLCAAPPRSPLPQARRGAAGDGVLDTAPLAAAAEGVRLRAEDRRQGLLRGGRAPRRATAQPARGAPGAARCCSPLMCCRRSGGGGGGVQTLPTTRHTQHAHPNPPLKSLQSWVGPDSVLVGTKCNSLLLLDVITGSHRRVALPPKPAVRLGPELK